MSKSGAPSASVSASASASSHDPHSLPPNVKGLIQRYLAVSIPTITLTPELIDVLDRSETIIPQRIQVTMRWWKEDSACSLSVYPKLNSPMSQSLQKRQSLLRQRQQQQQDRQRLQQQHRHHQMIQEHQQQLEHQHQQEHDRQRQTPEISDPTRAFTATQPSATPSPVPTSGTVQAHSRSAAAASFLRRPWSGTRLLNVFRKGKAKSKNPKATLPTIEPTDADMRAATPATVRGVDAILMPSHVDHPASVTIVTQEPQAQPSSQTQPPSATASTLGLVQGASEVKPLPSLPDAAYPITVAYPVRCPLDQLRRYFVEMTSLTIEVQITPELSVLATVPNMTDLFNNINGTFSGVFSFSTVLQNDNPRFRLEKLFQQRVVLGMVVFQAWFQDTSDVGDDSEDSDSISTNSMLVMLAENAPGAITHHPHPAYPHRHHPTPQTQRAAYPSQQPQQQQRPTPPFQYPSFPPQHMQPASGPSRAPLSQVHPFDQPPHAHIPIPQTHLQPSAQGRSTPVPLAPDRRDPAQVHPLEREGYGHRLSMRFDQDGRPISVGHGSIPPRLVETGLRHERPSSRQDFDRPVQGHLSHPGRYHASLATSAANAEAARMRAQAQTPLHLHGSRSDARVPVPEMDLPDPHRHHHYHHHRPSGHTSRLGHSHPHMTQHVRQQPSIDESVVRDNGHRSRETHATRPQSSQGGGARSRPRAGATAAAIGRLESVLARGEDLLHGMRTSLALDPEEVRSMSARNIRSSAGMYADNFGDDRSIMPYHEVLPYWPTKSRFSLEMSIPTAYLTSRGLLKGSSTKHRKYASAPTPTTEYDDDDHHEDNNNPRSSSRQRHRDWERYGDQGARARQHHQHQQSPLPTPRMSDRFEEDRQEQRESRQQATRGRTAQRWEDITPSAAATAVPTVTPAAPSTSTPRQLRRSGRPIQFEKLSARSDLARLRLVQEESMQPRYQSFEQRASAEAGPTTSRHDSARLRQPVGSSSPYSRQQQQQSGFSSQRQPGYAPAPEPSAAAVNEWPFQQSPRQSRQPRKSRSYPQDESRSSRHSRRHSRRRSRSRRRRRLSSNDRLQIRMNPRAGDMLNYIPDLFPSRSVSALLVPEYYSSLSGSSGSSESVSPGNGSSSGSMSSEDDFEEEMMSRRPFGVGDIDMSGRQSRLQKRPHRSYRQPLDVQQRAKRHQSQRFHHDPHQQRAFSGTSTARQEKKSSKGPRFYPQHFNFKVQCQLQLTPEVMAACMVENISVEVWKLNSKRQTMVELGSAKLPLHKVLSRIMQKTAAASAAPFSADATSTPHAPPSRYATPTAAFYQDQGRHHRYATRSTTAAAAAAAAASAAALNASVPGMDRYPSRAERDRFKEGWRLEPSVYDIRSRQGTLVGQLDADVWIHPRSRSDSMVSAAA
ncbi:hypothetical protein EDD11_001718 [Mortierella claussenii]|nr:hypothetical protein EDD11_001718 [Mortierella claussenii]